uniref:Chaperone DnaJ C-terminal domain-containing protein n=1 Tax=Quercus lobata TaxID=97700 RepID=A0A7N2N7C4_QUELO
MQGDWNHVDISCKIDHWASRNGKYAPVIARMGVHVECICPVLLRIPLSSNTILKISCQAILGGTIQVPTLTGDVVLKVRFGTQPGQKVVLKKKGIKTRNSYSFGDQYVHFNVSIPS